MHWSRKVWSNCLGKNGQLSVDPMRQLARDVHKPLRVEEAGMNQMVSLGVYLALGLVGGLLGSRLKITGGTILGAMLAVIMYKVWADKPWPVPKEYTLVVQILIGMPWNLQLRAWS